jgi:hypothetical protein
MKSPDLSAIPSLSRGQVPSVVPSLAKAFEPERIALRNALTDTGQSSEMVVLEARRALDRTAASFTNATDDVQLQKAGLWLLEMIKSGAGVLDRGTDAVISYTEIARPKINVMAGRGLFYGAAGAFALAGFVQGSGLVIFAAAALAALRLFDPGRIEALFARLPFRKKPMALEDASGARLKASAHVAVDPDGFIDSLADAVRTADHILLRLAGPDDAQDWSTDSRLMGVMQNLLEAKAAGDGAFALKVIEGELGSLLSAQQVEIVHYSKKTKHLFDALPALGEAGVREAAPALMSGETVLRRGTVWVGE